MPAEPEVERRFGGARPGPITDAGAGSEKAQEPQGGRRSRFGGSFRSLCERDSGEPAVRELRLACGGSL
jgi:hypothetical protein